MTTISYDSDSSEDDEVRPFKDIKGGPSKAIKERCIKTFREFCGIDDQLSTESEKEQTAIDFLTQAQWDPNGAAENYWMVFGDAQIATVKKRSRQGSAGSTGESTDAGSSTAGPSSLDDTDEDALLAIPVVKVSKPAALVVDLESSDDEDENVSPGKKIKKSRKDVCFATYNVNGSNNEKLLVRTNSICEIIKTGTPDVVFLQDVVQSMVSTLDSKLGDLYILTNSGGKASQEEEKSSFLVTLFHKTYVTLLSYEAIDHGSTDTNKKMLIAKVSLNGVKFNLVNIHFEDDIKLEEKEKLIEEKLIKEMLAKEKLIKEKRIYQFEECYEFVRKCPEDEAVIVAGDLCMDDPAFTDAGGLPPDLSDTWIATGSKQECGNTLNSNTGQLSRRDRILLRNANPPVVVPALFNLLGTKRIKQHKCYPSQHCGILCAFNTN